MLVESNWFPEELGPVVEVLLLFSEVKHKCFSWDLQPGWAESIQLYSMKYAELQCYSEGVLGLNLLVTWKIHSIVCHLEPFLTQVSIHYTHCNII